MVLFIHTSDSLCYLGRKQTVIHLPTPPENVAMLTCELQNFFISLKTCCVFSNVGGCEESQLWVVITGCDVWQLECQASNVTTSVQSDHFLCQYMLAVFLDTDHLHSAPPSVLKFSPCRNKPLPQATTRLHQYTHSCCSVPQMQY